MHFARILAPFLAAYFASAEDGSWCTGKGGDNQYYLTSSCCKITSMDPAVGKGVKFSEYGGGRCYGIASSFNCDGCNVFYTCCKRGEATNSPGETCY
jgi:hypothetical protein